MTNSSRRSNSSKVIAEKMILRKLQLRSRQRLDAVRSRREDADYAMQDDVMKCCVAILWVGLFRRLFLSALSYGIGTMPTTALEFFSFCGFLWWLGGDFFGGFGFRFGEG